jgi:hypothetical protein
VKRLTTAEEPHWRESRTLERAQSLRERSPWPKVCHSTDITDALDAADPGWSTRHYAEVLRRGVPDPSGDIPQHWGRRASPGASQGLWSSALAAQTLFPALEVA